MKLTRKTQRTQKDAPAPVKKLIQARMMSLTMEELRILFTDETLSSRQRLMFKVGFWHGLRVSELVDEAHGLKKEDIADGFVRVRRLKGSLPTIQPYQTHSDPVLDEASDLRELHRSLSTGERCFPMDRSWARKLMQRVSERHGIPAHKMHPHALKHTIAMLTIKKAGIEHVRIHLGHKSIASTGEYLKVTEEQASKAISSAMLSC